MEFKIWRWIWRKIFKKKRNGKRKEYYFNGKLKFEGEYLNGETNGKGKDYYYDCKLIFQWFNKNDEKFKNLKNGNRKV